jgi:hypothetical protein
MTQGTSPADTIANTHPCRASSSACGGHGTTGCSKGGAATPSPGCASGSSRHSRRSRHDHHHRKQPQQKKRHCPHGLQAQQGCVTGCCQQQSSVYRQGLWTCLCDGCVQIAAAAQCSCSWSQHGNVKEHAARPELTSCCCSSRSGGGPASGRSCSCSRGAATSSSSARCSRGAAPTIGPPLLGTLQLAGAALHISCVAGLWKVLSRVGARGRKGEVMKTRG